MIPKLEQICEAGLGKQIVDAARSSMGTDISDFDLLNIKHFSVRVIQLSEYRDKLSEYLLKKMNDTAPNLSSLIGELVGARLISHAGSLTNLAKYPASTIQILGAEKALFRALKTKGNTPKYGLLFNSSFISRAGTKDKGRISRYLANKCSIASRFDAFSDIPSNVFGKVLKEQVEERLKFYESGKVPRKNQEAMKVAVEELKEQIAHAPMEDEAQPAKKSGKKETKKEVASSKGAAETTTEKKKKKKKVAKEVEVKPAQESTKKRKKPDTETEGEEKKKKKKKVAKEDQSDKSEKGEKKKKKKKKEVTEEKAETTKDDKGKKKKKKKTQ
jgi:nucleolar protein 56